MNKSVTWARVLCYCRKEYTKYRLSGRFLPSHLWNNYDGEFETIFIEAQVNNTNVVVGEIYRIQNTNECKSLARYETILNKLNDTKSDIISIFQLHCFGICFTSQYF